MLDLGDDVIAALTRGEKRNLLRAMQEFMKFMNELEEAKSQSQPATEKQLDYLKEVLGEDTYRMLDGPSLTRDQVSELIKHMRENGRILVLPNKDQCAALSEWFTHNGVETPTIEGLDRVILFDQKTLDALIPGVKELREKLAEYNINLEELDLDKEDLGIDARDIEALKRDLQQQPQTQEQAQQRDPVKGPEEKTVPEREMNTKEQDLTARVVEDPIKSHDGMDIDTRTAVVETTGYQWKQDIADRVAQAREAAISEEDFEQKLAERGIQLDRATDGEYLYRAAESPWHNIRGDSLGERFTRNSFKELSLSSRAEAVRQASKGLAAERDVPGLEHSVISR